jgi:hypothetical protein
VRDGTVRAHVVVRAAPWIDVTSVDIVVEGRVVTTIPIPGHPTVVGPETGSLEDAQLRTLRLEDTVAIDVGPGDAWVLVVARGTRKLDDVLPFMPVPPRAFTNPVWIGSSVAGSPSVFGCRQTPPPPPSPRGRAKMIGSAPVPLPTGARRTTKRIFKCTKRSVDTGC